MGQTAAEIEAGIRLKRRQLGDHISGLEQRVRSDVDAVRSRTTARADDVKDAARDMETNAVDKVKDVAGTHAGSGSGIASHPKTLLVGAALGGMAIGAKTGGRGGREDPSSGRSPSPNGHRLGLPAGGVFSALSEAVRDVVSAEAGALVDTVLDAGSSGLKSAVKEVTGIAGADTEPGGESLAAGNASRPLLRESATPMPKLPPLDPAAFEPERLPGQPTREQMAPSATVR